MAEQPEITDLVVLVVSTVQDGTVVHWYRDKLAARNGRDMASASRLGVMVAYAPRDVIMAALDAHEELAADPAAEMGHLATHVRLSRAFGADLEPARRCGAARSAGSHEYRHTCGRLVGHQDKLHRCACGEEWEPLKVTLADGFGGAPR